MCKKDLRALTLDELQSEVILMGEKAFRAKQIFNWLHKKNVTHLDEMLNVPKALKANLNKNFKLSNIQIVEKLNSKKDGTVKYLFELEGGHIIESVFMKYKFGNTACISSQVGCRMGCKFCASTLEGLERNLTAGEMVSQIYEMQKDTGERISNIVLMGSGEPFDNFDNFQNFIKIINSKEGLEIGQRHITVSTCGLVDKIYQFSDLRTQVNLAISLHAPNDEIRKQTMPVANRFTIDEIIEACRYFYNQTKRRVTYEYALISGVNDSAENALELSNRLRGTICHVNLIPVNNVKERNYIKSSKQQIEKFSNILSSNKIEVTIRRELGSDINAACGQLRKGYKEVNSI